MKTRERTTSTVRSAAQSFLCARRGNVAIIFALTLPLVIGGLGFGVETSYWYLTSNRMQSASDAAAFAGTMEARSGTDLAGIRAAAVRAAADNGFDDAAGIEVRNPPASGVAAGSAEAVEVVLNAHVERIFTAVFAGGDVNLRTRSVARYNSASTACILALHPTIQNGANFSGSSQVTLTGCSVMSNSVSASAVNLQGSATLKTDCVIAVGGVTSTAGLTLAECDAPVTQTAPVADPFRNLPVPARPLSCQNDNLATLEPGRYCNGMTLKNTKVLKPGVYYIEGGEFRINANADVSGSGVTFYLGSGVRTDFNGTARMVFSAPTSGPYSGILFFGDRDTTGTSKFTGTADSALTGAIYLKGQEVAYQGNFSGAQGCTQVVARTIEWSGSTSINADCSALGMSPIPAMLTVKLIE
jgi:hypothetical protein